MAARLSAFASILVGGASAATIDLGYAFILFAGHGATPGRILQSIASGLIGKAAYQGGAATAAFGLLLHFTILIVAAAVFYAGSREIPWLHEMALVAGLLYGVAIYAVMNLIVVPLSAFPHPQRFGLRNVLPAVAVHMVGVGLPISLCAALATRA